MSKQPGRRRFSREFKLAAVRRMAEGANVSQLARELGISRKGLYEWRDKLSKGGPAALRRAGRPGKSDAALQGEVIEPSTLARQSGGANELARAEAIATPSTPGPGSVSSSSTCITGNGSTRRSVTCRRMNMRPV